VAIPKDAPHKENAHIFTNFLLRPEIAAEITNQLYTATVFPNLANLFIYLFERTPTFIPHQAAL